MGGWWEKGVGRRRRGLQLWCGLWFHYTYASRSEVAEGMPLALSFLWESLRCIAHKACLIAAFFFSSDNKLRYCLQLGFVAYSTASLPILKLIILIFIRPFSQVLRLFIKGTAKQRQETNERHEVKYLWSYSLGTTCMSCCGWHKNHY